MEPYAEGIKQHETHSTLAGPARLQDTVLPRAPAGPPAVSARAGPAAAGSASPATPALWTEELQSRCPARPGASAAPTPQ